jgi:hypothetical protein
MPNHIDPNKKAAKLNEKINFEVLLIRSNS